jgi:hypothetical protein
MAEPLLVRCLTCGTQSHANSRFCSSCGARLVTEDLPTFSSPRLVASPPPSAGSAAGSGARALPKGRAQGSFATGTVLQGRYQIVVPIGRGGMGEVYRADDLTLGQPVALKFLPRATSSNEDALDRLRAEVRIARRISHPNVCRVYDIAETEGRHFLSMEYIDGEDLAALLRRIGRLPGDKALDVARKVCAGLAAAHEKGVLHRALWRGELFQ